MGFEEELRRAELRRIEEEEARRRALDAERRYTLIDPKAQAELEGYARDCADYIRNHSTHRRVARARAWTLLRQAVSPKSSFEGRFISLQSDGRLYCSWSYRGKKQRKPAVVTVEGPPKDGNFTQDYTFRVEPGESGLFLTLDQSDMGALETRGTGYYDSVPLSRFFAQTALWVANGSRGEDAIRIERLLD